MLPRGLIETSQQAIPLLPQAAHQGCLGIQGKNTSNTTTPKYSDLNEAEVSYSLTE